MQQPAKMATAPMKRVKCWAHRGIKGVPQCPENSLEAFREAVRQGADGIESDVHISKDEVVIILHDPSLERCTNGKGLARDMPYYNGIDQLRTLAEPHVPIPTFDQLVDFLMLPENSHLTFNIDCKPMNDPVKLFQLMAAIVESKPDWKNALAPRLILGLWHPRFLAPARQYMPCNLPVSFKKQLKVTDATCTHLGGSPTIARQYFWDCQGFSMYYSALRTREGQAFLKSCQAAGKLVICWTANEEYKFDDAKKWNIDVVITDKTGHFVKMRDDEAKKVYHSWIYSLCLEVYHQLEAYRDAQWQHRMIKVVDDFALNPNSAKVIIV